MVLSNIDPANVALDVVDAVWDRLAQLLVQEIVDLDLDRLALRFPLPAPVLELADEFFLLRVN